MENAIFITSLHRPFSQQLKATKWVCNYIVSTKQQVPSSSLNLGFFYYLIIFLHKEYEKKVPEEYNGLPSAISINNIYNYVTEVGKDEFFTTVPSIIKFRKSSLDKQIYSAYKAASYYVNLAKDKFGLLDGKNKLTIHGKQLLSLRSTNLKLSVLEKVFFFRIVVTADFHLFMTHCLFARFEKKYNLKSTIDEQLEFIEQYLGVRHFNFTSASLANYNVVRDYWADTIGVLDKNRNIKKKYLAILEESKNYRTLFNNLKGMFIEYEKLNFKAKTNYSKHKDTFIKLYKQNLNKNISDLGFINLYDLKSEMKMSYDRFQVFLDSFYEREKSNLNIFFGNNVNSIDRRERFLIRQKPVIKIKIK